MDNGDAESSLNFDFEEALNGASGSVVAAPSSGAASSNPAVGAPSRGRSFRQIVCRHWVRGLCMKGDECSFLHQYDMDRMPVCRFFSANGHCREEDCVFKHINPDVKDQRCEMYDAGFCPNGPYCRYKHVKVPGPPPPLMEVLKRMEQMNRLNYGSSNGFYQHGGNNYGLGPHNQNLGASATPVVQQPAAHHVQTVNSPHVPPPPPQQQLQQNAQGQGPPNGSSNQPTITANPLRQGQNRYPVVISDNQDSRESGNISSAVCLGLPKRSNEVQPNEAFESMKNGDLIFSIYRTHHFQWQVVLLFLADGMQDFGAD